MDVVSSRSADIIWSPDSSTTRKSAPFGTTQQTTASSRF